MRYYIIDSQGNVHGDSASKEKAEAMLQDIISVIGKDEADKLELEIVDGE